MALEKRFEAEIKEIRRRKKGVLAGRVSHTESWEDIPNWAPLVLCVKYPTSDGYELVAYNNAHTAHQQAERFNENATDNFLSYFGKATVFMKIGNKNL